LGCLAGPVVMGTTTRILILKLQLGFVNHLGKHSEQVSCGTDESQPGATVLKSPFEERVRVRLKPRFSYLYSQELDCFSSLEIILYYIRPLVVQGNTLYRKTVRV
jgi:hypothetical protein